MGPLLILNGKYELGFQGCLCLKGYRAAHIGRWDEPEPSDQTDFDLRQRLDLNGGGRQAFEAGHD
jgi:hypothetical protein